MSPTPMSPINRLSHPERTTSQDSTDGIRKRVCKACDRCRLKKSKCDGSSPCSRCKADNAICVFGERKRSQDKIYPKGYVEMLEQQQSQLVSGLKEMYHRLQNVSAWEGPSLDETSGQPLTHDILSALNLLESKHDDSGDMEVFEENCDKLQAKMVADGANYVNRRGSLSSDSEHDHPERPKTASSRNETPTQPKSSLFKESFHFLSESSSPLTQSPIPRSKPFAQQHYPAQPWVRPSPLQEPTFANDPQLYAPEWAQVLADTTYPEQAFRAKVAMQTTDFDTFAPWDAQQVQMEAYQFSAYQSQMNNVNMFAPLPESGDLSQLEAMEFDFSKYVQQPEVMT